jgi:hypothetical protein
VRPFRDICYADQGINCRFFIDASVGINILILKYKGQGEKGCGMLETFVMKIKQWGSASWSVRLFLEVGCGHSSFISIRLEDQKCFLW